MISVQTVEEGKRYRIFVSGGKSDDGKRLRVSERFAGTKTDANRRGRAIAAELDTARFVARQPDSFATFIDSWWPAKSASIAPTTARTYRGLLDRHLLPALANRPVQKITAADLGRVFTPLVESGHVRTADHCYLLLTVIFNAAMKRGVIGRSPLVGVDRPKVIHRELTVLGPAEWQRVREWLEVHQTWALRPLSLLLTLGCRRSELCGLQWGDVDLDRRVVYVRRAFHNLDGGIYREPKSARSRRAIALDSHSLEHLASQRAAADKLADMFGRTVRPSDPVFARPDGRAWSPDVLTDAWVRVAKALKLTARLHDLRHSSATLMLAAGVPVQLVSQRLGHATAGFTLTVYAGVLPGAEADAAEKLATLLNGPSKALAGTVAAG